MLFFNGLFCVLALPRPPYYYFAIEDKFGGMLVPRREKDKAGREYVTVDVQVAIGDPFFAWIFGMKNKITIIGPDSVKKQFAEMIASVGRTYRVWG